MLPTAGRRGTGKRPGLRATSRAPPAYICGGVMRGATAAQWLGGVAVVAAGLSAGGAAWVASRYQGIRGVPANDGGAGLLIGWLAGGLCLVGVPGLVALVAGVAGAIASVAALGRGAGPGGPRPSPFG